MPERRRGPMPGSILRFALALLIALTAPRAAQAQGSSREITRRQHAIETTEGELRYSAVAIETRIDDLEGEPAARFTSWAYFVEDVDAPHLRPISFFFNGGPGAASLWLHLGLAAPRRIPAELATFGPGEAIEQIDSNPLTLLTASDLVFIDPVGTGFSRAIGEYEDRDFWSIVPDAESVAQLVARLLDDIGRQSSPVILVGESYGAIRATTMLDVLARTRPGIDVAGAVLISPALDRDIIVGGGRIAPYATRLPSYAALAFFHGRLEQPPKDLWSFLDEVRTFALGEYTDALEADALEPEQRDRILDLLVRYTGIPRHRLARNGLKANRALFSDSLRGGEGVTIGSLDARYVRDRNDRGSDMPRRTFNTGLRSHLRDEFGIDTDGNYKTFNSRANSRWTSYDGKTNLFRAEMRVVEPIVRAFDRDPAFELYVASGIYDLVTPFASAHAMLTAADLDPDRVTIRDFEAGHMVYLHDESFRRLNLELRAFAREVSAQEAAALFEDAQPSDRARLEATAP